jgi:hypothetical protein
MAALTAPARTAAAPFEPHLVHRFDETDHMAQDSF